jgi:ubiquinone/menaquinone biosynthesis C-methylase UbiE
VIDGLTAAYSETGAAWARGPSRIYDRLAAVILARSPVPIEDRTVVDVGAGTGAATRAAFAAGAAAVVAVDRSAGMLAHDALRRPPAVIADAVALPFPPGAFDAAVAMFSLNHLTDPARGLREMSRVTRRGGPVLASSYSVDDAHPVKEAVEAALSSHGWEPEPWYAALKTAVMPLLATVEACSAAAADASLHADVELVQVPFPELDAPDLVAWRLGLAQHAPFLRRLPTVQREAVVVEALARLGDSVPTLVRSVLVVRAVRA